MGSQLLGSFFTMKFNFKSEKIPDTSPHLGIADVQAVQNAFLASCVFKKTPMEYSIVFLAFWLAHSFGFDTCLDCCSTSIPWMLNRNQVNINLVKKETHNHNQFAPRNPSCHDLVKLWLTTKSIFAKSKVKINIYTIKIIFQTCIN